MSDILETMLAAVPDSYQKTVGFPIYDILAAAAIRMGGTEELLAHIEAMLDPDNLTGDDLDAYIYPRTGQVRNAATKAVGVLTVTGTGTITAGDLFERRQRPWTLRTAARWQSDARPPGLWAISPPEA